MFHVPRDNPRIIDDQFVQRYPALGMRTTSNSGAYWGDGDLCPVVTDYGIIQFAMESKVRYTNRKTLLPSPQEYIKALDQLRKRNAQAIRLFLVYTATYRRFGITLPEYDAKQLEAHGFVVEGESKKIQPKGGDVLSVRFLDEGSWNKLYNQLKDQL